MRINGRGQPTIDQYEDALQRIRDLESESPVSEGDAIVYNGRRWILEARTFARLVDDCRQIIEEQFPVEAFNGGLEPGSRFVSDLRHALDRLSGSVEPSQSNGDNTIAEVQWAVFRFRASWSRGSSDSTALAVFDAKDMTRSWFFSCFTGIDAIQRSYTHEVQRLKREGEELDGADGLYVAVPLQGPEQVQVEMTGSWQADVEILRAGARRPVGGEVVTSK